MCEPRECFENVLFLALTSLRKLGKIRICLIQNMRGQLLNTERSQHNLHTV